MGSGLLGSVLFFRRLIGVGSVFKASLSSREGAPDRLDQSFGFPLPPLKFRTAGFPQYGFKWTVNRDLRPRPEAQVPSTYTPLRRLIRSRSSCSQEYTIPEGINRPRTLRFNMARHPAIRAHPSRGPWLAIGLYCPNGSSFTMASSAPLDPSPSLMDSRRGLLHPRYTA